MKQLLGEDVADSPFSLNLVLNVVAVMLASSLSSLFLCIYGVEGCHHPLGPSSAKLRFLIWFCLLLRWWTEYETASTMVSRNRLREDYVVKF